MTPTLYKVFLEHAIALTFTILHSQFSVHNSPFTILHSQFKQR
ncbi:MAG: hypothetical protein AB4352_13910 [Hormoscilla sp.]